MKMRFYTPVCGVAEEFGCATLGFAGAEDASASKSELYPVELSGKVIYGTYEDCLNQIEKGDWKAGIVLFGNGGNENDFMHSLSEKLRIPFVGGSAATNSQTGESRLVLGRNQVALFLIDDDEYEFEAVCENIHSEILGTYNIGISDSRWIDSIDGNDPVKWLEEKKNQLGISPDDFEHLTFSDEYGINAHLSKVDGRIFSGKDLSEKMILRYVPKSEVQARIQKFYDDKDAIIFGCAGLKGILDEGLHTEGLGLFMFGEVCTIKNHSDFGNLMLSKLRIVKKDS